MHCHCGTNNRAPRRTFTDPCKPEVRPGAQEESASPSWLAAIAIRTFEIVYKEVLWSERGSYQTIWRPPLPNVTRHSGWWPYTTTPSIDQTFPNFYPFTDLDLIIEFDFLPYCGMGSSSIEHLQRVRHTNRGHLLIRTPSPVPFVTCKCSNVTPISPELVLCPDFWVSNIPGYFCFASSGQPQFLGLLRLGRADVSSAINLILLFMSFTTRAVRKLRRHGKYLCKNLK